MIVKSLGNFSKIERFYEKVGQVRETRNLPIKVGNWETYRFMELSGEIKRKFPSCKFLEKISILKIKKKIAPRKFFRGLD